jgi:hypothetical protein
MSQRVQKSVTYAHTLCVCVMIDSKLKKLIEEDL